MKKRVERESRGPEVGQGGTVPQQRPSQRRMNGAEGTTEKVTQMKMARNRGVHLGSVERKMRETEIMKARWRGRTVAE